MILRSVVLASGLCGAMASAQFPAYSDQYLQRLGGAVDALDEVVADFDASAAALGMTRDQALAQMKGSEFVDARRQDMQRTFDRHAELSADLTVLQGHGPFMRAYYATRLTDPEVARGALGDFQPALPLNFASALFALFGFFATSLLIGVMRALVWRSRPLPA